MNREVALRILQDVLDEFRHEPYEQLRARVQDSEPLVLQRTHGARESYQIEVQFFWDDRPGGNIRVMGSVDDGGWRAFVPLTRSFIKAADGTFVGE
jgi:hypothetical protein